jgi:c(7)-type cytochrome triheme protein
MAGTRRAAVRVRVAALGLAIAISAAVTAGAAPAPPGGKAVGFEHQLHDRDLVVSGGDSLPCARCHAMRNGALIGAPDHATCFGGCHGPPPARGARPGDRLAVCTACHAEAALVAAGSRTAAIHYPPFTLDPNFAVTVGHRRHRELACAACHAAGRPAPHRRCAGCHDGSGAAGRGPAMTACTGCHTPATGAPLPPEIVHAEVNVAGAFSHARHAARGAAGARCTTCHAAVLDTDDNVLPAPSAQTCAAARCHDGTAGFPITAACTRCHRDPDQPGFKVERPSVRYSHEGHAGRASPAGSAVALPCASCHPLTPTGEVTVVGHAPCATCHADDFGRRQPRICGACHNGTEPWRALVADRGPAERTEFGATLDHDKHPRPCGGCHALTTAESQLRPPRGHRACTGAACHAVTGGPAPRLAACETCHRPGLARERQAARLAAPWSVRAKFDHASHARTATGGALACDACHVDLAAPDVTAVRTPPKPTCAPCHDGTAAFKLTGTMCTRCHQGARR